MAAGPVPASIVWKRLNSSCAPCSGIIPSLAWVWLETCLVSMGMMLRRLWMHCLISLGCLPSKTWKHNIQMLEGTALGI